MARITDFTVAGCLMLLLPLVARGGGFEVADVQPPARSVAASVYSPIAVRFSDPVDRDTISAASFSAFGRWSGPVVGEFSFSDGDQTVTLTPLRSLSAGEQVMVVLSHDIRSESGNPLREAGYSYQFWTRTRADTMVFSLQQDMTTRDPEGPDTRTYGGVATDVNDDGWLDITTTNEDTNDVRVFLNAGDGDGMLDSFITPVQPVGSTPSPSEPADFDGDGLVDLCIANTRGSSVSVLLGNGDGTWRTHTLIEVGNTPRGIAVLDADGDGDADIVNTNADSSSLSILLNDGSGGFADPVFFDGGTAGEWALAAADMNEDGILDLVVGSRSNSEITVLTGNGDGTFSFRSRRASGGRTWMINVADVSGDGHDDVICANSTSNRGSVLLGNGDGTLGPATNYSTDPFPLATDLGDLDGDGDLDWVTSSFSGDWFIFENDGSGEFSFVRELPAPSAASCALPADLDNDRDLDLALVDEIADRLITYMNSDTSDLAAPLTDLTMIDGHVVSGTIDNLAESDNVSLTLEARVTGEVAQPHLLQFDLGASTAAKRPAEIELTVEARITDQIASVWYSLRDWDSGDFEQVAAGDLVFNETVNHFGVPDAGRFVRDGDGRVEVRIKAIVFLPFTLGGFRGVFDQVELRVW